MKYTTKDIQRQILANLVLSEFCRRFSNIHSTGVFKRNSSLRKVISQVTTASPPRQYGVSGRPSLDGKFDTVNDQMPISTSSQNHASTIPMIPVLSPAAENSNRDIGPTSLEEKSFMGMGTLRRSASKATFGKLRGSFEEKEKKSIIIDDDRMSIRSGVGLKRSESVMSIMGKVTDSLKFGKSKNPEGELSISENLLIEDIYIRGR